MYFNNSEELLNRIKSLKEIGKGTQGTCYLDINKNIVYKIFNQYFDNDYDKIIYTKEEFLQFKNIENNTFIWPKDIIMVKDEVVGYIISYIKARPLYTLDPLEIELNTFYGALKQTDKDINILSQNNVLTFDLMYNVLYNDNFYVTDCDEFSYNKKSKKLLLELNRYNFNMEFYYFLIIGYFDEFVADYHKLNKMYKDKDGNILEFIDMFLQCLNEYMGFEIKKLSDAKKCLNKQNIKRYNYLRDIIK